MGSSGECAISGRLHPRRVGRGVACSVLALAGVLAGASAAIAAPGDLDASFGTGGLALTEVASNAFAVGATGIVRQSDGKFVVVGQAIDAGNDTVTEVARYTSDGALDTTFGDAHSGITTLPVFAAGSLDANAVALAPDGGIIVAGELHNANPAADFGVARLSGTDGSVDTSFGSQGVADVSVGDGSGPTRVTSVVVDPSTGDIFAGGGATAGSVQKFTVVALTATGGALSAFGGGTVTTAVGSGDAQISGLGLDGPDVVAAGLASGAGNEEGAVVRYTSTGDPDSTFDAGSPVIAPLGSSDQGAYAVLVQPDHKVVVGGFGVFSGSSGGCFALARLDADGGIDSSFGSGGTAHACAADDDAVTALALDSEGAIYAAGYEFDNATTATHTTLTRFTSDGVVDTTFGGGAVVTSPGDISQANAITLDGSDPVTAGSACNGAGCQGPGSSTTSFAIERFLGASGGGGGGTPPTVSTGAATAVAQTSATLNGTVDPNGSTITDCYFERTRDHIVFTSDGSCLTNSGATNIGDGTAPVAVHATVTDLSAHTTYDYRLVVVSRDASGTSVVTQDPALQEFTTRQGVPELTSGGIPGITGAGVGQSASGFTGFWNGSVDHFVVEWLTCAQEPPPNSSDGCQVAQNDPVPPTIDGSLVFAGDHYTITPEDEGRYVALEIKAVNGDGAYTEALSTTELVPKPGIGFTAGGAPTVGEMFTGDAGVSDRAFSYQYTWLRCRADGTGCSPIPATSENRASTTTYVLVPADVGHRLRLRVTTTSPAGGTASADSDASKVVLAVPGGGQVPGPDDPLTHSSPTTGSNGTDNGVSTGMYVPPGAAGGAGSNGSNPTNPNGKPPAGASGGSAMSPGTSPGPGGSPHGGAPGGGGGCVVDGVDLTLFDGSCGVPKERSAGLRPGVPPLPVFAHAARAGRSARGHKATLLDVVRVRHLTAGVHYLRITITPKLRRTLLRHAHHGVVRVKVMTWMVPAKGSHARPLKRISTVTLHLLPRKDRRRNHHGH